MSIDEIKEMHKKSIIEMFKNIPVIKIYINKNNISKKLIISDFIRELTDIDFILDFFNEKYFESQIEYIEEENDLLFRVLFIQPYQSRYRIRLGELVTNIDFDTTVSVPDLSNAEFSKILESVKDVVSMEDNNLIIRRKTEGDFNE